MKTPRRSVQPDADYVAQREEADGQKMKRSKAAERGKPVRMPSSKPTNHDIDWTHPLTGKRDTLRVTVTPDYLIEGTTHLEIRSRRNDPHPLSMTDYRSHFLGSEEIARAGGAVAFVRAWIKREMSSPRFVREDLKRRQGGLFEWADAQQPAPAKKPRRPGTKLALARVPQRRPG